MNTNDNTSVWFSHGRSARNSLNLLQGFYRQNKQTTINDRKNKKEINNSTAQTNNTKKQKSSLLWRACARLQTPSAIS